MCNLDRRSAVARKPCSARVPATLAAPRKASSCKQAGKGFIAALRNVSRALPQRGNAIVEAIVAFLALAPLLVGMPLLGKQFDVERKTRDVPALNDVKRDFGCASFRAGTPVRIADGRRAIESLGTADEMNQ
jgi:hypothetical protein